MGMQAGGGGGAMSEINVTPLVDVMLVLLIIFMVATPLIEQQRAEQELQENRDKQQRLVTLNLPVKSEEPPPPELADDVKTVTLRIDAQMNVAVGNAGPTIASCTGVTDKQRWVPCFDQTRDAMADNAAAKQYGVSIEAAPGVPFGYVVGIVHRLQQAGITKVGMMPR